jgi:hypothetical protein
MSTFYIEDMKCCNDMHMSFLLACNVDTKIENGKIQVNMLNENKFLDIVSVKCDTGYVPSLPDVKHRDNGNQ